MKAPIVKVCDGTPTKANGKASLSPFSALLRGNGERQRVLTELGIGSSRWIRVSKALVAKALRNMDGTPINYEGLEGLKKAFQDFRREMETWGPSTLETKYRNAVELLRTARYRREDLQELADYLVAHANFNKGYVGLFLAAAIDKVTSKKNPVELYLHGKINVELLQKARRNLIVLKESKPKPEQENRPMEQAAD